MSDLLLPAGYAVLFWWASTGLALVAVRRSRERSWPALAGAGLLLAAALAALAATRDDPGATASYVAFSAAIGAWGAAEIAFLTGWLAGPWRAPCPPGAAGWARAGYALGAILWHELSLLAVGAAILLATWGGSNAVGPWCFAVLLLMRVSAKLNIFLGVPNITEDFLPKHLAPLKSFFRRSPMNPLFPVSVTVSTVALAWLAQLAWAAEGPAAVGLALLAAIVALGLLEHWFLVLPLPVETLWAWGLAPAAGPDRREAEPAANVVRLELRPAAPGLAAGGAAARKVV